MLPRHVGGGGLDAKVHETKIMNWIGRVHASLLATKAGAASEDTLLIPRPPSVIGKVA